MYTFFFVPEKCCEQLRMKHMLTCFEYGIFEIVNHFDIASALRYNPDTPSKYIQDIFQLVSFLRTFIIKTK